jgi:hypothetical protein
VPELIEVDARDRGARVFGTIDRSEALEIVGPLTSDFWTPSDRRQNEQRYGGDGLTLHGENGRIYIAVDIGYVTAVAVALHPVFLTAAAVMVVAVPTACSAFWRWSE